MPPVKWGPGDVLLEKMILHRGLVHVYRCLRGWRWWPVRYRAWLLGANLRVGTGSYILSNSVLVGLGPRSTLVLGKDVCLRRYTTVEARDRIEIGDDTLIAEMVTIRDHDHKIVPGQAYRRSGFVSAPIRIGRNVWIGNKVTVCAGVTIGDNTVVAANAVVTKDLPANVLAGGVPARVIRDLRSST